MILAHQGAEGSPQSGRNTRATSKEDLSWIFLCQCQLKLEEGLQIAWGTMSRPKRILRRDTVAFMHLFVRGTVPDLLPDCGPYKKICATCMRPCTMPLIIKLKLKSATGKFYMECRKLSVQILCLRTLRFMYYKESTTGGMVWCDWFSVLHCGIRQLFIIQQNEYIQTICCLCKVCPLGGANTQSFNCA